MQKYLKSPGTGAFVLDVSNIKPQAGLTIKTEDGIWRSPATVGGDVVRKDMDFELAKKLTALLGSLFGASAGGKSLIKLALTEELHLDRQDYYDLVMIFGPIVVILLLLLTAKESVGCGFIGGLLGARVVLTETGCRAEHLPWILQLIQNAALVRFDRSVLMHWE